MGPIDYSLSVQQPFQSAVEGFKFGAGMKQMADERAALQAQQAAQQQMQQELAAAAQDPRQLPSLMVRYPQLAEKLKIGWDTMNGQQQQASLAQASEVFSALHSGRADVAQANLRARARAMRDAGDEQGATLTERMAQWAETHPESLKTSIGLRLAAIPGGDKVIEAVTKLGGEQRAADLHPALVEKGKEEAKEAGSKATTEAVKAKYAEPTVLKDLEVKGWNIKNLRSQISDRAKRTRIDEDRLALDVEKFVVDRVAATQDIGTDGRKIVNDSALASGAAKQLADKANNLAGRITEIGSSWGFGSSFSEWLKKSTGEQDAVTQLRNEYARLRNTEAIRNLPPGPATDKDILMAQQGMPPDTADPRQIQSFLLGMAKMADIDSAVNNAKADFATQNKGLLNRARKSFQAGGIAVPEGEDWVSVAARVAKKAAAQYEPPPPAASRIPGAMPQAATSSIRSQADAILAGGK